MKEVLCKVILKNKHADLTKLIPTLTKNKLNLVIAVTILKQNLLSQFLDLCYTFAVEK